MGKSEKKDESPTSGFSCTKFWFDLDEDYKLVAHHNCTFWWTQLIRLIMMMGSFLIWGLLLYVWAKAIFAQLQFYILTLWLVAISTLSCAAGREVTNIERKRMLAEAEKNEDGEAITYELNTVFARRSSWKLGVMTYSVAAPLILASPIMFFLVFRKAMFQGEVCKFVELANVEDYTQEDCLENFDSDPQTYIDISGFRFGSFITSIVLSVFFLLVEMCLNQLQLAWKSLTYQYVFTAFYALVTLLWQESTGDATIFPGRLDWVCSKREPPPEGNCLWDECGIWFVYFAIVQTGCFILLKGLHWIKGSLCCNKSPTQALEKETADQTFDGLIRNKSDTKEL